MRLSYPWGEPGTPLANEAGPEEWQRELDEDIARDWAAGKTQQFHGRSSGHGIGKSTEAAHLIKYFLDCWPGCKITVSATTVTQLRNRTWAELVKWHNMSLTKGWYDLANLRIEHIDNPTGHFAIGLTARAENSEAFAGQHEATAISVYILDEASGIPDPIWDVAMGSMTDRYAFMLALGNPTRAEGRFWEIWNGKLRGLWSAKKIDSRSVPRAHTPLVDQYVAVYGEEHDFVRVRVRGEFPKSSILQFIDHETVALARKRILSPDQFHYAPRVLGVDIARFGDDQCAFARRQGLRCWPIKTYRQIDTPTCAGLIAQEIREWQPTAVFVDKGNFGAAVIDMLRKLGHDVIAVDFSTRLQGPEYNRRAQMYSRLKEWLADAQIPDDDELATDLTGPQYGYSTVGDQVILESKDDMKARGLASPDKGDALACTFATDVYKRHPVEQMRELTRRLSEDPSMLIGVGAAAHERRQCRSDQDPFGGA